MIRPTLIGLLVSFGGCASGPQAVAPPSDGLRVIERALPAGVSDRAGWVDDLNAAFSDLKINPNPDHVCAVIAVVEQESGFRVDPVIPDLGAIARREIDRRAEGLHVPLTLVHAVLELKSSNGATYADRIDQAKTERELSDVYEDFTGSVPLGRTLLAGWNPIRTRGPMQVNVAFAEQFSAARPYPYAIKVSIDDELFTRRGSVYFGTAHLLDYQAGYDRYLYRFADFNAGQYASRNAAFQAALSRVSGLAVTADGALVPHGGAVEPGNTELAARSLGKRLNLGESQIHDALEQGRGAEFARTSLYRRVFELADRRGPPLPRALLPDIKLQGPKITRNLTTAWYAHRVDGRYQNCLHRE